MNNSEDAVYMTEDDVEESDFITYTADENEDGWYEDGETMLILTTYENDGMVIATTDGDENGSFDSSALTNSNNTNALDAYLSEDGTAYEGECNTNTALYGVWFGALNALSDDSGAFIYGTYLIEELSCDSNEGEDLLSKEATISEDGKTVFAGYFVDLEVDITTQLLDKTLKAHTTFLSDGVTLVETINYTDLKTTSQYYFLVKICDEEGNVTASAQTEVFNPEASSAKNTTSKSSGGSTVRAKVTGSNDSYIFLSCIGV